MSSQKDLRVASHAGDWYTADATTLDAELSGWLSLVDEPYPIKGCKALIAPHAGYTYSGPTAAWAYKSIDTTGIKRVFVLGPSHHVYLDGCALSGCKQYATPLGNLPLDLDTIQELKATGKFESLGIQAEEDEHSLEMHLPYIRKMFEGKDISIVPIMVGAISKQAEAEFGALLAPYLAREDTFCVVSSDFCHWGTRFSYTYYYPAPAPSDVPAVRLSRSVSPTAAHPIHKSISQLDHEAMALLTLRQYLARTKNTICGRHPIGVLLGALTALEPQTPAMLKWVHYEQNTPCLNIRDSSVSYASAWIRF
ncbi:MEMO1 family [Mycena rosella]|uniref:MEMO1 family n=1 Tax=Mycena rosella TaxID=1033263 RepID=A0AAD7M8R7_MYCRO|nr:MEMO1 family [Mycena rosella]